MYSNQGEQRRIPLCYQALQLLSYSELCGVSLIVVRRRDQVRGELNDLQSPATADM